MPKSPDLTLPLAQPITLTRYSIFVMARKREQSNLTFEPHKTEDGTGYYILVTWPDGRTARIGGLFKDETAALDWIRLGSRAWIARRKKS